MGEGLMALSGTAGYIGIALVGYRLQFQRLYRRYKKWQAENPSQTVKYCTDYDYGGFPSARRAHLSFHDWFSVVDSNKEGYSPNLNSWTDFRPGLMMAWPLLASVLLGRVVWVKALDPFLHPKGEKKTRTAVDYNKINKLEKELGLED